MSSCAWVVCSVYVFSGSFAVCASSILSASMSTVLCLCWVIRYSVCVYVCCACALSTSSVTRLLFMCLGCLLCLRSLWLVCYLCLVCFVCVCVCSAMSVLSHPLLHLCLRLLCFCLVRIFCGSSAICVLGSSTLSAFSVPHPLRLRLRLLRLCLCLRLFLVVSALLVFFKIFTL